MLTFDDGYRDNFNLAYPVLKNYQVPALFFIPTLSISNRTLGWWDIIAYFIKNSRKHAIQYDGQTLLLKPNTQAAKTFFLDKMKATACGHTADLLARLADTCEVSFPSRAIQDAQLMTWDHIREMALGGMGIGSHGHTHRVMATLPSDVQEEEMRLSKEILEAQLDIPIRSIAYPVGDYAHFTPESKEIAKKCGYHLGFSFNTGYTTWEGSDHFNMLRLSGPEDLRLLKGIVTLPKVFTWNSKKIKRGGNET
jgi:peptidoglycan/xylan/chitin deacetylase (PgdA/CDA1 family)